MPCTLQPFEIAYEERRVNREKFDRSLTDEALLEEVACIACRCLDELRRMKDAPVLVQKWWRLHKKKDAKRR